VGVGVGVGAGLPTGGGLVTGPGPPPPPQPARPNASMPSDACMAKPFFFTTRIPPGTGGAD